VNLAHWRLAPHVGDDVRAELAAFYRDGLERVRARAERNPYRLGTPLVWCSTNDVIAFATQAVLYEEMTGDITYRALAAEARDWIFGRNPWGVSFVIGVPESGDAASRPHHMFHELIGHLPVGGLVDGPVYRDINEGLKFSDFGEDRLARFQSDIGVYHDVEADFSTNEPIIDGTVSVFMVGSTGSLTTIEHEPGVVADLQQAINRLAPPDQTYAHELAWHDGNGHSHVQAALLGPSIVVPVRAGKLRLGTWQQIVAINHDNRPRNRGIEVTIVGI
jgi:secondary thiamine-phosphate synthase enzyme